MPVNALAPDPRNAMLRPYEPSWKEQIAAYLMGNTRPSPERRQFAQGIADILGYLPGTGNVLQGQEAARAGDTKGAIMAMLPLPGANVAARAEQAIAQDVAKGIRAYHGSPHDFPRFDISKIGTGEGNQVYGHGLYFAEHEPVALKYRESLSFPKYKGVNVQEVEPKLGMNEVQSDVLFQMVQTMKNQGVAPDEAVRKTQEELLRGAKNSVEQFKTAALNEKSWRAKQALEAIEQAKLARTVTPEDFTPHKGHMYEVRINAEPEQFLNWELPLDEQPAGKLMLEKMDPKLRENLEDMLDERGYSPDLGVFSGREVHSLMQRFSNEGELLPGSEEVGAPAVAEYLRSLGIPGVRYQDAGSRGAANKTFNYVVNNDKLVEVMRKYGLMGPIGAGIAAKILARQEQRQDM
jgi:hypothetical protein